MPSSSWELLITPDAEKELARIDPPIQKQILRYFLKRVLLSNNPQSLAKPLVGKQKGLWRYRIGDYRAICSFENNKLVIVLLSVNHRREVYKKL